MPNTKMDCITAELAVPAIKLVGEGAIVKWVREDQTDIESFYTEEVRLYVSIDNCCREVKIRRMGPVSDLESKIHIGVVDDEMPWTTSEVDLDWLMDRIKPFKCGAHDHRAGVIRCRLKR
jgi:hypothetical protein